MRQDENMPILLKTQVESADKTPVTACRARGGGLCGFRGAAGVPAESLKTGRCAAVRENRKFDQSPAQRVRSKEEMRQTWETPKRAKSRDFGRRGEKAGQSRGGRARPAAVTSARGAGSFGDLRGRSKHSEKQLEGVAE